MKQGPVRSYWRVLRLIVLADWLFVAMSLGILGGITWASLTLRPPHPELQPPAPTDLKGS